MDDDSSTVDLVPSNIPGAKLSKVWEQHPMVALRWWLLCRGISVPTTWKKGLKYGESDDGKEAFHQNHLVLLTSYMNRCTILSLVVYVVVILLYACTLSLYA